MLGHCQGRLKPLSMIRDRFGGVAKVSIESPSAQSSQIANVREEVEQTRPILDSNGEAKGIGDTAMEADREDGNDKTVATARDYQVSPSLEEELE